MRVSQWVAIVLFFVMGASAGNVLSSEAAPASASEYLQYLTDVRASLKKNKPRPLSSKEWQSFEKADASIRSLLGGHENVGTLSDSQRIELYNAQEQISGILNGNDDERVICRQEGRVGTSFRETRCVTLAQRRSEREAARDLLLRTPNVTLPSQ